MKKLIKILATFILLAILLGYLFIWRSPDFYQISHGGCQNQTAILDMSQYEEVASSHNRPFVFEIDSEKGGILVYGSEHTRDPADPQLVDIDNRWVSFEPTVVLVEGRLGFLIPGLMDPVKAFGEMGKVAQLAKRSGVPLYSWDVPKQELATKLLRRFSREQVALSLILNPYFSNLRYGQPKNPDAYVMNSIARAGMVGMQSEINAISHIDKLWQTYFPNGLDWRETSDQWGLPGFLQEIANENNLIRNEKLLCAIQDLLHKGERVFVIGGSSHAVCIEKALRKTLD